MDFFDDPFGISSVAFLNQPIDVILFRLLIWFGWIPVLIVLVWGFIKVFQGFKQGKYVGSLRHVLLAVDVPSATEQSPKALEHLFANLIGAKSSLTWKEVWIVGKVHPTFSFEIVSNQGYIQFYVRTQTRFRDTIEAGIYAHYPDAEINEVEDYVTSFPESFPNEEFEMWGSEFTLTEPAIFPLRTYVDFEDKMTQEIKDPLAQTLESLSRMKPGEHFWMQFVCQAGESDWRKAGNKYINQIYGKEDKKKKSMVTEGLAGAISIPSMVLQEATGVDLSAMLLGGASEGQEEDVWKAFKITPVEKEQADAVLRKVSKIGLHVKTRILYWGRKDVYDKQARTAMVKGVLLQYTHLNMQKFGLYAAQTPKDDYFWQRWVYTQKQERLVKAFKGRSWGTGANPSTLNTEELASLWHFPAVGIKTPLIKKVESRRAEPPSGLPFSFDEDTLPTGPAGWKEPEEGLPGTEPFSRKGEPPEALPSLEDLMPDVHIPGAEWSDESEHGEKSEGLENNDKMEAYVSMPESEDQPKPAGSMPTPKPPTRSASLSEDSEDVPPNLPI